MRIILTVGMLGVTTGCQIKGMYTIVSANKFVINKRIIINVFMISIHYTHL